MILQLMNYWIDSRGTNPSQAEWLQIPGCDLQTEFATPIFFDTLGRKMNIWGTILPTPWSRESPIKQRAKSNDRWARKRSRTNQSKFV